MNLDKNLLIFFVLGFISASLLYNFSITYPTKNDYYSLTSSAFFRIHLAVYSFTDMNLAKILVKRYKKGVDVKVVVDPSYSKTKAISYLIAHGIPVRTYKNSKKMHIKLLIVDNSFIIGSHNFSFSAFNTNKEFSLMFNWLFYVPLIQSESQFEELWTHSSLP